MKYGRHFPTVMVAASVLMALAQPAYSYDPAPQTTGMESQDAHPQPSEGNKDNSDDKSDSARRRITQTLQAANVLLLAQRYGEAQGKLSEFDGLPGKMPQDIYLAERMRIVVAVKTGNDGMLIESLEKAIGTNQVPAQEKKDFDGQLARAYFKQKNYAKASMWAKRYFADSGTDADMHRLLAQSYFLNNEFAPAKEEAKLAVQGAEKDGKTPSQEELRLLAASANKAKDSATYTLAVEKLVSYYPKPEHWAYLLEHLISKPGFPDRLALDVYRLMQATGQINTAKDYLDMADIATRTGYAVEAKKVLDKGFDAGVLGKGADAAKERDIRAQAARAAANDMASMAKLEPELVKTGKNGELLNLGYLYVVEGKADKGLPYMEKALASGALKNPEEARLHLGVAYVLAGKKDEALKTFKSIQSGSHIGDVARYWTMYLSSPA